MTTTDPSDVDDSPLRSGSNIRTDFSPRLKAVGAVTLVLLALSVVVLGWRLTTISAAKEDAQEQVAELRKAADGITRAEKVALDYAVGAADMSYTDIPGWVNRLTAGTTPELTATLKQAATATEQVIVPMQWVSTPTPLAAKVKSSKDGVYTLLAFVGITTRSTQTPDGIQSTAVYTIDIDSNRDWIITSVGGAATAVGGPK